MLSFVESYLKKRLGKFREESLLTLGEVTLTFEHKRDSPREIQDGFFNLA